MDVQVLYKFCIKKEKFHCVPKINSNHVSDAIDFGDNIDYSGNIDFGENTETVDYGDNIDFGDNIDYGDHIDYGNDDGQTIDFGDNELSSDINTEEGKITHKIASIVGILSGKI